jgi:hypothetical protein
VQIISIQQRQDGRQGFSGAEIGYYDVAYTGDGSISHTTLVTKNAPLVERRTLAHLGTQGLPVPFSYIPDLTTDALAPICMQHVGEIIPERERGKQAASALAAIHYANLGRADELHWLPQADPSFIDQWLIQACWRTAWQSLLAGGEFIDGYGQRWGLPEPGGDFPADFAGYTQPLEAAAKTFLDTIHHLWEEGDSLTLIHADFHHDHVLTDGKRPYIIDWGSARYGPLYLDLPNYFTQDEALLYRGALEALGLTIPQDKFLAYYDAVRPYPGFKYFGIGLSNWCFGNPPHNREHVLHFINMIVE